MLHIRPDQLAQLSAPHKERTLRLLCEALARHDVALTGGRSVDELLPVARRAADAATSLGLRSGGAVALITTLFLALERDPSAQAGLRPLIDVLSERSSPEEVRLMRANELLFDLEESLPQPLRRSQVTVRATPELDV